MKFLRNIFASMAILFYAGESPAQAVSFSNPDFGKADSIAALYAGHSLVDLRALSDKLTRPLFTEIEKFRAIYRWVCDNIENDYGLYLEVTRQRVKLKDQPEELHKWNKDFNQKVFRKLLKEHKTMCTGYAYLVKELTRHAGIRCVIVNGYGRTPQTNAPGRGMANHSWNAVQLDGRWYLCDPTWSSGTIDPERKKFIHQFSEAYFLADPALFVRNHYPIDTSWTLLTQKPTLQQFLEGPLVYKEAFHIGVNPVLPDNFQIKIAKGDTVTFRFERKENRAFGNVELQVVCGTTISSYFHDIEKTNDMCTVSHTFNRKGIYVAHLLLDEKYVFTYEVKVSSK